MSIQTILWDYPLMLIKLSGIEDHFLDYKWTTCFLSHKEY